MQNSLVPILTPSLTAKFIRVMKMMKPVLSVEATDLLAKEYTSMRALDSEKGIDRANALTARAMEASIVHTLGNCACQVQGFQVS